MRFVYHLSTMLIVAALSSPGDGMPQPVSKPFKVTKDKTGENTRINPILQRLTISRDRRRLVRQDGTAFFYLGDTAWELFHRPNLEDAFDYLKDRAAKGFTVIQAVVLAEFGGLTEPNPDGELPLMEGRPDKPNEAYFKHVDLIVDKANALGLYVGMLPTWGDKWNKKGGTGPEIFNPENARKYGEWLGKRYKDKAIIWILGGDRPIENDQHKAIIRAMAEGLRAGDGGSHLMTYHPGGGISSSEWLHDESWLDFNMMQSGHARENNMVYRWIARDYQKTPVKPTLDGEPNYEDHPINWNIKNRYFNDYDVRKLAYWSVFAGAAGHTYGCNDVWQFFSPMRSAVTGARLFWKDALGLPGAIQMTYLRKLIDSRPFLSLVPDQSLLETPEGSAGERIQACRDAAGNYAFIYLPTGKPVKIKMTAITGSKAKAYWFNPRLGSAKSIGIFQTAGVREFTAPSEGHGNDWVLVIDNIRSKFRVPAK